MVSIEILENFFWQFVLLFSEMAPFLLLGLPFAILRPVAAFVTAMFGGVLTNAMTRNEENSDMEGLQEHSHGRHHGHDEHCCSGGHCGFEDEPSEKSFAHKVKDTLEYGFVNMLGDVSKWLLIGLLVGALIAAFVPDDFFLFLHDYPVLCMLVVLVLAMPMYTCATESIPLALALVEKGITPGAALVLLMAGHATSIAGMLVVGKAFGKQTLVAYLTSIAFGALVFGFVVDTFFMDSFLASMLPHASAECHGHEALGLFDYICAALLAVLIVYAKFAHRGCDYHGGCCGGEHECCCCGDHDDGHCHDESCGSGHHHDHEEHGHHHDHDDHAHGGSCETGDKT